MKTPKKFRKKPVEIRAILWTGDNLADVIGFTGLNESVKDMPAKDFVELVQRDGLKIFTPEGKLSADIGDWIIEGHSEKLGFHHWPVKPDYFESAYEPIT